MLHLFQSADTETQGAFELGLPRHRRTRIPAPPARLQRLQENVEAKADNFHLATW